MSSWSTRITFEEVNVAAAEIPVLTLEGKISKVGTLSARIADYVHPYLYHPEGGSMYGVGVSDEGKFTVFREKEVLATGTIEHCKVMNGHGRRRA